MFRRLSRNGRSSTGPSLRPACLSPRCPKPYVPDLEPLTAALSSQHAAPRREISDGLYRPVTYLAAKLLEEGIIALLQSIALSVLVFFPLQLTGQWLLFFFTYLVTTCIGIGVLLEACFARCCTPAE